MILLQYHCEFRVDTSRILIFKIEQNGEAIPVFYKQRLMFCTSHAFQKFEPAMILNTMELMSTSQKFLKSPHTVLLQNQKNKHKSWKTQVLEDQTRVTILTQFQKLIISGSL